MTSEVMTKKVASEMLLNVMTNIEDHERQDVFWEAVDMAIEVLRAENDLIDRVLETLDKEIDLYRQLGKQDNQHRDVIIALTNFRKLIVRLKEGEQE